MKFPKLPQDGVLLVNVGIFLGDFCGLDGGEAGSFFFFFLRFAFVVLCVLFFSVLSLFCFAANFCCCLFVLSLVSFFCELLYLFRFSFALCVISPLFTRFYTLVGHSRLTRIGLIYRDLLVEQIQGVPPERARRLAVVQDHILQDADDVAIHHQLVPQAKQKPKGRPSVFRGV